MACCVKFCFGWFDGGTTTEVIKCKTTLIGQVVGPQGSTVNEIKKSTGAEIEVSESSYTDEDSLVTISGSKSAVSAAKARVEEIIKNAENPDSEDGGTTTEVIKCKTTLIDKVAGPQGSTVNEIKTSTGAEIEVSESSNKDEDSLVTISGPKNAVSAAKARVEEIIKNAETPDFEDEETTTEVIKCKTTWIGQVIGPQGSTVNEIKTSTGAEIEISKSSDNDEDSLVTISGSKNDVNAAKARVEEIIKDAENPDYEGSEGRKWREEADRCAKMAEECAKEKDALFEKGDKDGGHKKLDEVKEYQRKMHEANGKAAEAIFNNRNKGKGDRYMDFHGLRKQEALDILETKMSALKGTGGDVELIPGAGHHSQGAAVLKPAVLDYLKKEGLEYEEQSAGSFLVHL